MELLIKRCERCGKEGKIILPYGPHCFCKEHFNYFFEKRIKKTIQKNKMIKHGEKIAVGLSGGKDSMALIHTLKKLYKERIELEAIIVDEGITGYRDKAIEIAVAYCESKNIPYNVVSFQEEFGTTIEKSMEKIHSEQLGSSCSFCGVFRRHLLNKKALEMKADKIAIGHNLDDECQSITMSFFNNDLKSMSRNNYSGKKRFETMVPRIKPLLETPEKEIISYCAFNNLNHYSEECCPYSWMAKRNQYRQMLNEIEEENPGTKFSILKAFKQIQPLLKKEKESPIRECERCGAETSKEICSVCAQLEKLEKTENKKNKPKRNTKKLSCAQTKGLKQLN